LFEQPRGHLESLFLVTQTKDGIGCIRDAVHFDRASREFAPEGT
jgi:hypothetical protein